jgi:DNA-binding NtrC family response regulator
MSLASVLVVNEISVEREEIARALEAEGFTVVQASSAAEAVREIWGGSFIAAVISTLLTGTTSTSLQQQLNQMAPEIETLVHGRNDETPALVRKLIQIRDGSFSMGAA